MKIEGARVGVVLLLCLLAGGALVRPADLRAQAAEMGAGGEQVGFHERELFRYPRIGRPDPFRSLLLDGELGFRIDALVLRGVVYHEDPARSVALLVDLGTGRRIQMRTGERVGSLRLLAIHPERVEIVVEELGVARREVLPILAPKPGEGS